MVFPPQAVINAIVLTAYAIQSMHLMLVRLVQQIADAYRRWQESGHFRVTLEFNNPNPLV